MFGKGSSLSLRRKSFNDRLRKPGDNLPLSGVFGNNLGFWMTAYLGFQTLGSIYGIKSLENVADKSRRHRD